MWLTEYKLQGTIAFHKNAHSWAPGVVQQSVLITADLYSYFPTWGAKWRRQLILMKSQQILTDLFEYI